MRIFRRRPRYRVTEIQRLGDASYFMTFRYNGIKVTVSSERASGLHLAADEICDWLDEEHD